MTELNPDQFTYHIDQDDPSAAMYVTAASEGVPVGLLHLDKFPGVGHTTPHRQHLTADQAAYGGSGWQYEVGLLAVAPDARHKGVASTMYRIAANHLGYKPPHDPQITPAAAAWAKKVGGAEYTKGKGSYPDWEGDGTALAEGMAEKQSHRVREDNKVPDDIARALQGAPKRRPPRAKPAPQTELPLEW